MANFFAELKRRHMYRVAAAYAVMAWLLLQIVNNVVPGLNLPSWAVTLVIVLLAVGFPVALLFCWIQHLAPAEGSVQHVKTHRVDWILAGGLAAVIAIFLFQEFASRGSPLLPPESQPGGISLAVLPFANLSGDSNQEFFSDGMTEEITAALAKVPNLRVVGRTSAFQFKGQNKDFVAIRNALGVAYLIDGSVRKDGDRVRITAQLVRTENGANVWTESYDRQLAGVFATQEDIAQAIASALRVPLGLKEGQSLVSNRTADTDSYQDFLRAKALVRTRGPLEPGGPLTEAVKLLEQVVARDPSYVPAWGLLGQAYALTPSFTTAVANGSVDDFRRISMESFPKAEAAAQQAVRLDPNNVAGYTVLGLMREYHGQLVQAEDLFKRALSLDPNDADALHQYGGMLALSGRLKDSLPMRMRLRAQEPLVPIFNAITGLVLWGHGRNDEAIAILKASPPGFFTRTFLAQVYASIGRYGEAADALQEIPSGVVLPGAMDEALRLLRAAPARAESPQTILSNEYLGFVYLYLGAPDRVLDFYEGFVEAGFPVPGNGIGTIWTATYAPVRKGERFKNYVRGTGMVAYWRERGWADLCRPMGTGDFVCD